MNLLQLTASVNLPEQPVIREPPSSTSYITYSGRYNWGYRPARGDYRRKKDTDLVSRYSCQTRLFTPTSADVNRQRTDSVSLKDWAPSH